jgi:hypothetical protein
VVTRVVRLVGHSVDEAAYGLGNGSQVIAQDAVPFALWTAATYLDDQPAAITACVRAGGNVDTTARDRPTVRTNGLAPSAHAALRCHRPGALNGIDSVRRNAARCRTRRSN